MGVQRTDQVSHDHHRALEHTYDEDVAPLVILVDLRGEFFHAGLDFFLGVQNVREISFDCIGIHENSPDSRGVVLT